MPAAIFFCTNFSREARNGLLFPVGFAKVA
jgi:hypothetical protein